MSQGDREAGPDLDGMAVEDAVEAVVAAGDSRDEDAVRAALETVAEDGVVTRDGAQDAVAHASKVVSTPETRAELAAMELEEARDHADPVADLDVVAVRLDEYESRLEAVRHRTAGLGKDLQRLLQRLSDPDSSLYAVGSGVVELEEQANDAQYEADRLGEDVKEFRRWLESPERRVRELGEDADTVAESVDEVAATVEDLADDPGADEEWAPGRRWAAASLRLPVLRLLLGDLRGDVADLREWAGRDVDMSDAGPDDPIDDLLDAAPDADESAADTLEEVATRLDEVESRLDEVAARVEAVADPAWEAAYGETVAAFEAEVADLNPPVDWGEVEGRLSTYRAEIAPE